MKNHEIQMKANHWSKLIALILVFTVALGGSSCKSKKRIAADKASEADIAAAAKVVSDSKKTAQQVELDDLAAAYKKKIDELLFRRYILDNYFTRLFFYPPFISI